MYMKSVIREELVHEYYIREEARARWLRMVLVDMVNELKSQPFSATYQQNCNRWRERESGPLRVLEDLRIITKPPRLSKTRVKPARFFYLNEAHNDEHLAWSIVTPKCMVEESLHRLSKFMKAWDMVAAKNFDAPETLSMYVASYEKSCRCSKLVTRLDCGASICQIGQREIDVMSYPVVVAQSLRKRSIFLTNT